MLRDDKTEPLALSAGIRVADTIRTDASGRVKILFNDDSSISLGPNTTLDMSEYADTGARPAFAVHVPQGLVRAITGTIVDRNPGGFRLTTPEATVGIRGTIISARVEDGKTTVYVESTLRQVHVNNINVPSGSKILVAPGVTPTLEPITPEDRRHIGRELAFRGGSGSVAAAPEAGEGGEQPAVTEQLLAAGGSLIPQETLNTDPSVSQDLIISNLSTENLQVASGPPMGHVSGTLPWALGVAWLSNSATFSFDVNLSSGEISNGTFNHTGVYNNLQPGWDQNNGSYSANLIGGTGGINPFGFTMDVSGSGTFNLNSGPTGTTTVIANVTGSTNLLDPNLLSPFSVFGLIEYAPAPGISPPGGPGANLSGDDTTLTRP